MANRSPLLSTLLIGLLAMSPVVNATEPTPASATADCAMGSAGADATGNDCGSLDPAEGAARFHATSRPAPRTPAPVASAKLPPVQAVAPRPAANWPEGQTACAAGGGADPTGNDCNGQSVATPIVKASLRR